MLTLCSGSATLKETWQARFERLFENIPSAITRSRTGCKRHELGQTALQDKAGVIEVRPRVSERASDGDENGDIVLPSRHTVTNFVINAAHPFSISRRKHVEKRFAPDGSYLSLFIAQSSVSS